ARPAPAAAPPAAARSGKDLNRVTGGTALCGSAPSSAVQLGVDRCSRSTRRLGGRRRRKEGAVMPERDGYLPGVPCWVDTSQPDAAAAAGGSSGAFFGGEFEDSRPPDSPEPYFIASLRGGSVAAVASLPEGAPSMPTWNTYIAVADADDAVTRARGAGGAVVIDPFD